MKDYYETPNGLKLLKNWAQKDDGTDHWDEIYEANRKIAYKAIEKLLPNLNLKSFSRNYFINGFAYTSTSDFAALWQCQAETFKKGTYWKLHGIAITTENKPVVVYEKFTKEGIEIGTVYELIN